MSIANEMERQLVKQLVKRYRALPEEERRRFPSLLNQVGKLEVAAGSFAEAQRDFDQAAALAPDQTARAEAHFNRFNAALEAADLSAALGALRQAVDQQPDKYALFPAKKYEPESILGAGGFGVAFLCRNKLTGSKVVVKALRTDTLARDMTEVFREAQVLEELDHSAIIRLRDCDYADAAMTRPYLVMDYFEGQTLERFIVDNGPLPAADLVALMRPVAEALQVAHARGILHRDVKPGNILVRRDGGKGDAGPRWRVKLIDFGLALKQNVLQTSQVADGPRTVAGYSIAGTLDYAAPEQLGKLPGAAVGPHTDVYGLARTCCQALFKTTQPLRKHWREIPEALADLLEQCLSEAPKDRLPNCGAVLDALNQMEAGGSASPPRAIPVQPVEEQPKIPETDKTAGLRQRDWWRTGPVGAVEIGAIVHRLTGHSDAVLSVAFSPDGAQLLSASADQTVRLWDVKTGKELKQLFGHTDRVWNVQFIAGSGIPLLGNTPGKDRGPRFWDQVNKFVGELLGAAAVDNAGGFQFAVSSSKDKSVRFWDLNNGTEVSCLAARTNRALAISRDGQIALTGNLSDGMIRVWEVKTGRELRRLKGHMSWVLSLAFSPSGWPALSGSADGTVRLWDVNSGRELRRMQGHADQVWSVAFSPNGNEALSASADKTVRWWDLRTGKELKCYHQYQDQVWSVAFSPDGHLALSDSHAGALRLWEPKTNRDFPPLQGHTARALCVAFSPDGRYIASGGEDRSIIIWQVPG
jgi:serine/threonine protein kinase